MTLELSAATEQPDPRFPPKLILYRLRWGIHFGGNPPSSHGSLSVGAGRGPRLPGGQVTPRRGDRHARLPRWAATLRSQQARGKLAPEPRESEALH
jgi:hypothetical protein